MIGKNKTSQIVQEPASSQNTSCSGTSNRTTRLLLRIFSLFTLVGILWIFFLVDLVSVSGKVHPKDYAAEEVENLKRAQTDRDGMRVTKMIDESATQYVNEVTEEAPFEEETIEEVLPPEPEEELEGEEF